MAYKASQVLSGWTSQSISHNTDLHDQSLATLAQPEASPAATQGSMSLQTDPSTGRQYYQTAPAAGTPASAVGSLTDLSTRPLTAADLMTKPTDLHDPTLGSRAYTNPYQGFRDAPITTSVYQQENVPAFLQQSIANLNAEQSMKRALQSELTNRLASGLQGGGPNSYLWAEALRAAAVNPGAHVGFGAAVQNPAIGEGYKTAANAYAGLAGQQAASIAAANKQPATLQDLLTQRARLSSSIMGGNPATVALDQRITDAYLSGGPNSSVQQLARSASGPSNAAAFGNFAQPVKSGWWS